MNVGILIKFTIIADQIHDIFINVTVINTKSYFICCRHIRSLDKELYIYAHSYSIEIKSVELYH